MASTIRGERLVNAAISFVVRPINIKAHIRLSALAPGEVSDLKAIPDAEGDFKATISFKAPELTINGQSLGSLTKIEVTRDGKLVKVFDTPAPGDRITFEDVATEGGDAQYIVTPYNSEGSGIPSSTVVFMGNFKYGRSRSELG